MAGGSLQERVDDILDEVERRLLDDDRMPEGGGSDSLTIERIDVRRGERTDKIPDSYPIVYLIHGQVEENDIDTHTSQIFLTVWLETYIRERDTEVATDVIKDYVLQERRVFRESPDDKRLVDDGGDALTLSTQTPNYDWGQFRPIGDSGEWEFGGLLELEFEFHIRDV